MSSLDYKLANIFGTVYSQGDCIFTPDGTSVLSPVGNRVSLFDVKNNRSKTFNYQHRKNVMNIAINNRQTLMISVDSDGRAILVNFRLGTVLHHMNFKGPVTAIKFSPDGHYIAVATGRHIQMWKTVEKEDLRTLSPFSLHRVYSGHFDEVIQVEWSHDSRFFLSASRDMSAHIYSLHKEDSDAASTLNGHRDRLVGAFFSEDQETIHTVSRDGAQFQWQYSDDEERWVITEKHYFNQPNAKVRCCDFHAPTNILVVGFSSGVFALYELPACNMIQQLSISQSRVDCVQFNKTGEWILFGAAAFGQLLVWEWQSESYVLKQQSHFDALNAIAYSPDGSKVVTGADDGKIKVWDANSGFAIITFTQHQAGVTALKFSKRGNVLFSASLDGSVRAWDLLRYRNFRTFTAASRLQFTSLAVDPSGELVCAGSMNEFDIHVWNVQTSQLVDRLAGHEGPVSTLDFSSDGSTLVSASWDYTMRLWNFFGRSALSEPMMLQSEALCAVFRPDGKVVAVSTMDGQIAFWDVKAGTQIGHVDARRDILGGRHATDRFAADNAARSKHINTLAFSLDGKTLIGGGNSKYICLYDVNNEVLLRRFEVSKNMALDGTLEQLNSKNMTDAGPLDLIDTQGENSDLEDRLDNTLPGAQKGDASVRRVRPQIRVTDIQYSPTAPSFSVASTEGLLVYSIDTSVQFDPFDLDVDITVDACLEVLKEREYLKALILAFRLGEAQLLQRVYMSIPPADIELVVSQTPDLYLDKLLTLIGEEGQQTPHLEFSMLWLQALLEHHGRYLSSQRLKSSAAIRQAQRFLLQSKEFLGTARDNVYQAEVLLNLNKD